MSIERLGSIASGSIPTAPLSGGAGKPSAPGSAPGAASPDFAAVLGEAVAGLGQQLRQAESVSVSAMNGLASVQDVVEKVTAAEQALQASIAVRDKIVAAYLEISRMAI